MKHRSTWVGSLAALLALAAGAAFLAFPAGDDAGGRSDAARTVAALTVAADGAFDYWLLALSWSPSYCAAEGASRGGRQCAPDGPDGFVVHGLWPQSRSGPPPAFCASDEPERISEATYERIDDLIPTIGLAGHQWRKHGSCSGLGQDAYYAATRQARDRIAIPDALGGDLVSPDAVERLFLGANPAMSAAGIAVTCDDVRLREVRICLEKDFTFTTCPQVDRRACSRRSVDLPR